MAEGLRAGDSVGGYRLKSLLGRGGMGVVFLAEDARLGRQVAVKVIAPERASDVVFRRRFERESQLAASIEHPNSVAVYEVGESAEGEVFIAMRYVEGTDLRALLRQEQWLEPDRAVTMIEQVAGALDEAHRRGLVHRDVKPGNVLIGEVGSEEWAYLTDFGATKPAGGPAVGGDITATGEWMGTADYASPEQIEGERVDARSDVYSLGCVLYETLTGRIPFNRENQVAKLYAHVNDPPPLVSDVAAGLPAGLDQVVSRALAKDRDERYPSAGDLGRAARAAVAGEATRERERSVAKGEAKAGVLPEEAPTTSLTQPQSRRWPGVLGAMAGLIALLTVAGFLFRGGASGNPEVVATIEVGGSPLGVAFGDDSVWVSDREGEAVSRIDPETNEVADTIPVGEEPAGVATGLGSVWVANSGDDTVTRVNPSSGEVREIRVGNRPAGIRVGEGSVWVANLGGDAISRIDPRSGRVQAIEVGGAPSGIGIGEGGVWVSNSLDDTVDRILPSRGEVVREISVGTVPRGVAVGKGSIWVANTGDRTVTEIDEDTYEKVGEPIDVEGTPAGITVGEEWIWVSLEAEDQVARIDPDSGNLLGEAIDVGDQPRAIDVGGGAIWVANSKDGSVTRIEG